MSWECATWRTRARAIRGLLRSDTRALDAAAIRPALRFGVPLCQARSAMSAPELRRIFISYSRLDDELVVPVVRLMRATLAAAGLVFQDEDSLRVGQRW